MEHWIDIAEGIFGSNYSYDVQCKWTSDMNLTVFLQEYNETGPLYQIDFGEIISFEIIDESLTFPPFRSSNVRFLGKNIHESVLFEIKADIFEGYYHYFVRTDYYVSIQTKKMLSISDIKII